MTFRSHTLTKEYLAMAQTKTIEIASLSFYMVQYQCTYLHLTKRLAAARKRPHMILDGRPYFHADDVQAAMGGDPETSPAAKKTTRKTTPRKRKNAK